MARNGRLVALAPVLPVLVACAAAQANIVLGTTSNFNDGDLQGWTNGQATDPQVLMGGPGGAGDPYLRVTSDGAGAGGKLTVFNNLDTWTGMWVSAGIMRVEMDLRNFDPQGRTLSIRMGFLAAAGPGQPGWCTQAYQLPADGQWHHAVFLISQQSMVNVGSPYDWETAMQMVNQVRIFHSTNPSVVGVNFASSMGIDNIVALPAPGAAALLCAGGLVVNRRRR